MSHNREAFKDFLKIKLQYEGWKEFGVSGLLVLKIQVCI